MPAKSRQQQKMIFARRGMYKTKANTPDKWKWIWDKGWEKLEEEMSSFSKYLDRIYEEGDDDDAPGAPEEPDPKKPLPKDIEDQVLEFFKTKKKLTDTDIHKFSESLGQEEAHQFENVIYKTLQSFLSAGRAFEKGITEKDVDAKELAMGVKVEMEHTTNPKIAKRIALDHLAERPDYYSNGKAKGIFDELK